MFDQKEDERGYLVYINRFNSTTQLDNPNLTYILNKINEKFATSKYSTYRCACKLFALQKALFTNYIPFQTICTILERHRLNQIDSAPSIKPSQLTAVLHDVYFAAEQLGYFAELTQQPDRDALISTLAGLLWSVFDPKRCNPLSVLELKQTFLLLCETSNFEQVVWEHFQLTSDHNLCVSRHRLEAVLLNFSKLLSFLGEPDHLKTALVQEIVMECFTHYPGLVGLTEYQFSCLFRFSSKFSYYSNVLALSKRLRESEFVVHSVACGACRSPIQGLRFKCQRCRNLSLCIDCFSHGYSSKSHKVGHKMYEISTNDIATNPFSSLFSKLCKMISCSQNSQTRDHQPSTYDNMEAKLIDTNAVELQEVYVPPAASSTLSRSLTSTSCASLRKASSKNVSIFSNIDCQLFTSSSQSQALGEKLVSMLEVLEEDGEKYRVKLANLKASGGIDTAKLNYFDEHGKLIAEQLKVLKEVGTKLGRGFPQSSSTPYRSASVKGAKLNLSAVQSRLEKSIDGAELNKSYVNDQLPSELSVRDVSAWFHLDRLSETMLEQMEADISKPKSNPKTQHVEELSRCIDNLRMDTQISNFKDLLLKVREIVDDSYSDNTELARTTQQLEKALDRIIEEEERKRHAHV
ncbi:dystrobrevin alpha isoform X1 [Culex quinquefasciatus]|uniref:dystrobrevin alpha isoform X1 n=1 Tax=Culex quinquefasciatus TaxID=7176 RepID=UPI0018E3841D|nr:dystrobrevin alpha isoform X1 [Culex quinquefasciatus]